MFTYGKEIAWRPSKEMHVIFLFVKGIKEIIGYMYNSMVDAVLCGKYVPIA